MHIIIFYHYICNEKNIYKLNIMKDSIALTSFLSTKSRAEKTIAVDLIVKECYVPRYTVHNWIRGLARIPTLHKRKIEELFGVKIFDTIEP